MRSPSVLWKSAPPRCLRICFACWITLQIWQSVPANLWSISFTRKSSEKRVTAAINKAINTAVCLCFFVYTFFLLPVSSIIWKLFSYYTNFISESQYENNFHFQRRRTKVIKITIKRQFSKISSRKLSWFSYTWNSYCSGSLARAAAREQLSKSIVCPRQRTNKFLHSPKLENIRLWCLVRQTFCKY